LLGYNKAKLNKLLILKYIIIFIIFLFLSILSGIPRLYLIWVSQVLLESYNILNHEYQYDKLYFQNLKFVEKLIYTYNNFSKTSYLQNYYEEKYNELESIYELPYHKFFMFDLVKFWYSEFKGSYGYVWGDIW